MSELTGQMSLYPHFPNQKVTLTLLFVACVSYRVAKHWWQYLVDTQQPMDSDMAGRHPNIAKNTLSSLKQIEYEEIRFVLPNQFSIIRHAFIIHHITNWWTCSCTTVFAGSLLFSPVLSCLLSSRPVPSHPTSSFHSRPLSHIGPPLEMIFCCCQYK